MLIRDGKKSSTCLVKRVGSYILTVLKLAVRISGSHVIIPSLRNLRETTMLLDTDKSPLKKQTS